MAPLTDKISDNITRRTPIQKFYSGTNIFITGGTGFLGMLLIEKLLRSCPEIENIYLLIRSKRGWSLQQRIKMLVDNVLFDRLREIDQKCMRKLHAIEGDVSLPELGISDKDRRRLTSEVSIVFHVAALVNFNEKLKVAVPINVSGTQSILNLSKKMTNLKAIVYVSTTYAHCMREVTEEKFYPSPIHPKRLIEITNILKDDELENITDSLLAESENTYTYTKVVAENIVLEESDGFPIGVFRPGIVTSTYKEPLNGWINNFYGPTGIMCGAMRGVIRVHPCDPNADSNIVPGDMAVNALIAVPWDIHNKYLESQEREIPIYHFESNSKNPLCWKDYIKKVIESGTSFPLAKAEWYIFFFLIKNNLCYTTLTLLLHYLPALLSDILLICMLKKPKFIKIYRKIEYLSRSIAIFGLKTYACESYRIQEMLSKMTFEDRKLFSCDLKKLDWNDYFKMYFYGLRVYLLNDPLSTLPEALVKWRKLHRYHQVTTILVLSLTSFLFIWMLFYRIAAI